MKTRNPSSTHKKVVIELEDKTSAKGYLNPSRLGQSESYDLLTTEGEHIEIAHDQVRAVYFVRSLEADFEPERRQFLSRPKLEGLWVKLRFRDDETLEGVISNDLLAFLDKGLHLTPPDFNANADRIYVPRNALAELTVLGVVGIARRKPAAAAAALLANQPRLFTE